MMFCYLAGAMKTTPSSAVTKVQPVAKGRPQFYLLQRKEKTLVTQFTVFTSARRGC